MEASERKYLRIQLLISALTLLLTPIFSAFVVHFQLSREHEYWELRESAAKSDSKVGEKARLLSEVNAKYFRYLDATKQADLAYFRLLLEIARNDVADEKKVLGIDVAAGLRASKEQIRQADEQALRAMDRRDATKTELDTVLSSLPLSYGNKVLDKYRNLVAAETSNHMGLDPRENVLDEMRQLWREFCRTKDRKTLWSNRDDLVSRFLNRNSESEIHQCMRELLTEMITEVFWETKDIRVSD